MRELSPSQSSLLMYLETRAVDHGGRVDGCRMNGDDFECANDWTENGFIEFGRIASDDVNAYGNCWVKLSDDAWRIAHEERRKRADRLWNKRQFETTEEKRES